MSTKKFAKCSLAICVVGLALGFAQSGSAPLTVEGTVKDAAGKPVPDVTVDLWQHGRRSTATSSEDGSYAVPFRRGRPISAVIYSKTGFYPTAIVEDLAGDESHQIHKTIRDVKERTRERQRAPAHEQLSELLDQLHAYEVIALLPLQADPDERRAATAFKSEQAENCRTWLQQAADDERLRRLVDTYDDAVSEVTNVGPGALDQYLRERISLVKLLYRRP